MDAASLAMLAVQLRGEDTDPSAGLAALADALSSRTELGAMGLVSAIESSGVLPLLIERAPSRRGAELELHLSILASLADAGGTDALLRHGAFQLFLSAADSPEPNERFHACAGLQNLTSDAFLFAAFAADLGTETRAAEERLAAIVETDGGDEARARIVRCASGALSNLKAIAADSNAAALSTKPTAAAAPSARPSAGDDDATEHAPAASDCAPAKPAAHRRAAAASKSAAAAVLQRRQRMRAPADAEASRVPPAAEAPPQDAQARATARARMRAVTDSAAAALMSDRSDLLEYTGAVQRALLALAEELAAVCGAENEAYAVKAVRASALLGPLLLLLLEHIAAADTRLLCLGLSALANMADIGGAPLLHAHGALEIVVGCLRSRDVAVRFYAVAAVQNLSAAPECALRLRGTGVERLLEAVLCSEAPDADVALCAMGALANIRRAARKQRTATAAAAAQSAAGGEVRGASSTLRAIAALPATVALTLLVSAAALPRRLLSRLQAAAGPTAALAPAASTSS